MAALIPALAPYASSLAGTALKAGASYLATEAPTIAKYLAKTHLLSGNFTPRQIIEEIGKRALTKEGQQELLTGLGKAVKVGGKIGHQALNVANKFGLGGSLTNKLKDKLSRGTSSIHEALGTFNKLHSSIF